MIKTRLRYYVENEISLHHFLCVNTQQKEVNVRPHSHSQCEIHWLMSGTAKYKIDGEDYILSAGDCLLLNSYNLYSRTNIADAPNELMVLRFSPDLIPQLTNLNPLQPFYSARNFRHILPASIIKKTNIYPLLKNIRHCCSTQDQQTSLKIFPTLLVLLTEIHKTVVLQKSVTSNVSVRALANRCIDYINANLSEKLTASTIAEALNLSKTYLQRAFVKELHISLHDYILHNKMQLAALLLNAGKTPQQVSNELGYDYYSTFSKNFQTYFGHTPSRHNYTHS